MLCHRRVVFALLIVAAPTCSQRTYAQDTIVLENGFRQPLWIWFLPREATSWTDRVTLPRSGAVYKKLSSMSDYYLAAQDFAGNEDHLNWIDLHLLANRVPPARLIVAGGYVLEVRHEKIKVTQMQKQEREGTRTVFEKVRVLCLGGGYRYEIIEREQKYKYTVLVPVTEVLLQESQVRRLKIELFVSQNGRRVPLGEFLDSVQPKKKE
jgi:hypothetical protein